MATGFSLAELLVALALLGLLTGLALPRNQHQLARQRRDGMVQRLLTELATARHRAATNRKACAMALEASGWSHPVNSSRPGCAISFAIDNTDSGVVVLNNFRGDMTISADGRLWPGGTVVVGHRLLEQKRCFVIAPPLGIVRTGQYNHNQSINRVNRVKSSLCLRDEKY